MKTSLEWLSQYLPGDLAADEAAAALTAGGLPVENIEIVDLDTVIDVEVTSNRSDCLSVIGVARELAALLDREFRDLPVLPPTDAGPASEAELDSVGIDARDLCPHYTARVIRNVKVGPSPAWLVRRLKSIGLRSINNVVDVTNYVLMEMGQPLHAFDLDKLAGRQINVRRAKAGEKLRTLDGSEHPLTENMLVIADESNPVALAGVMGGLETEVTAQTVNVLLESARFDPLSIRTTARALAMGSDSSYRYERGIDPTLPQRASRRAVELLAQVAGGKPAGPLLQAGDSGYSPKQLWLRLARLQQVLGVDFPAHQVVAALDRLRLSPVLRGERIDVTVPSHRLDINHEIDLVEEAARIIGYDKIPVSDEISLRVSPVDLTRVTIDLIRGLLIAGGYFEALTLTFVTDALASAFQPHTAGGLPRADARVRKADASLRPSLLPGLLESVRHNETVGNAGVKLFEIGSVFWTDDKSNVVERRRVGIVGGADYRAVRGVVETTLSRLNADLPVTIIPAEHPGLTPGGCGQIRWGDTTIGFIGKVDRTVLDKVSLRETPVVVELELADLIASARHVPQLRPLPRFPAVRRDLSLVVPEVTRYERLENLVAQVKPDQLEAVDYVTTYRGKPLEPGTKSVTLTLVFRSPGSTLTSEAVESSVQKVIDAAKQQLGAVLRA